MPGQRGLQAIFEQLLGPVTEVLHPRIGKADGMRSCRPRLAQANLNPSWFRWDCRFSLSAGFGGMDDGTRLGGGRTDDRPLGSALGTGTTAARLRWGLKPNPPLGIGMKPLKLLARWRTCSGWSTAKHRPWISTFLRRGIAKPLPYTKGVGESRQASARRIRCASKAAEFLRQTLTLLLGVACSVSRFWERRRGATPLLSPAAAFSLAYVLLGRTQHFPGRRPGLRTGAD